MITSHKPFLNIAFTSPTFIGISGGVDSVACSYFLTKVAKLPIKLFHFNHRYIKEDDAIEDGVRKYADFLGVDILVKNSFDFPIGLNSSSEAACREARVLAYQSLKAHVIVCHSLSDCLESYLMNTLRGKPEFVPIPVVTRFGESTILRPFMLSEKKDFEAFANRHNLLKWVMEDPMNLDMSRRRNWIRGRLIPCIESHYTGLNKIVRKKMIEAYKKAV